MRHSRTLPLAALGFVGVLGTVFSARAASLEMVPDWGANGVPSTTSMYIYVPDQLAPNPPILVVAHFCGGTAGAVFGQVQGGGIVAAADQYGFIIVVPQTTNNCWDVGSTASLTHDGGGETQAVAQMVEYTISEYQANAERVYITGDSSGAMMTQAMLAVYPEVFKGGSEFAGVPAGCWAVGNPDGSWSGECADGMVTHTEQEWGDIVRDMHPEYMGHRPRVQLFHGDADSTIRYANHTEAIKQWVNVLGLATEPTTTDMVALGSRQARRERWENACGFVVLEALTSLGGDHGPSDAIFEAEHVVPFLGLDSSDPIDPEIAACGESGAGGGSGSGGAAAGGAAPAGGATNTGGRSAGGSAGSGGSAAGMSGGAVGGVMNGGGPTTDGVAGQSAAGAGGAGGATDAPPVPTGTGGPSGGAPGAQPPASGGAMAGPGASAPGETTAPSSSMLPGAGGAGSDVAPTASSDAKGCACAAIGSRSRGNAWLFALPVLGLLRRRRVSNGRASTQPRTR